MGYKGKGLGKTEDVSMCTHWKVSCWYDVKLHMAYPWNKNRYICVYKVLWYKLGLKVFLVSVPNKMFCYTMSKAIRTTGYLY